MSDTEESSALPLPAAPAAIVFTDLDATLLDHHTYSWQPAQPALKWLAKHNIPVILTSSKTLAEMQQISDELSLRYPLVVENGAAVAIPSKRGPGT